MLNRTESTDPAASDDGAEWNPPSTTRSLDDRAIENRAGSDGLTDADNGGDVRRADSPTVDAILAIANDACAITPAAALVGAKAAALMSVLRRVETSLCDGLPVESVLGVRYRRAVSIIAEGVGEFGAPGAAKFGFRIRLPRSGAVATVVFDRAACEALSNVFMAFYAPLRGYGDPTRVEVALLEFATTLTLAELRREGADGAIDAPLVGFLERGELARIESSRNKGILLRVAVDQREGRAAVFVSDGRGDSPTRVFPRAKRVETRADMRSTVEVRLALPSIEITASEWKDAALGDVLLLGATDLAAMGSVFLVTDTGWRLAPATIVFDSPTAVGAAATSLDPDAFLVEDSAPGCVRLALTLGGSRTTLEQIAGWREGTRIDLPKSAALPISIFHGGVELARGELVRADGELGVRLGAIYHKEVAS